MLMLNYCHAPHLLESLTPDILKFAIKYMWGPCYPMRSAEQVVGSLCDA